MRSFGKRKPIDKALHLCLDISPESGPALELHSRAATSVEAHHHVQGDKTGRNYGGRG